MYRKDARFEELEFNMHNTEQTKGPLGENSETAWLAKPLVLCVPI